ncbi:hypothetical protein FVE85_6346 [Porphyridium purpureum]|uniref:Pyridoxamine 5'-phosphate oxidase N-terminal domain-containing protein n=1 Tax=Porphyridium purpureum TaxID=35688 RepID=A0A5J4Z4H5_PORPP|nr:hypothetical protein FVE85_6346 [Porphyridium purpureum]|eukprot:POR8922..scf295_1
MRRGRTFVFAHLAVLEGNPHKPPKMALLKAVVLIGGGAAALMFGRSYIRPLLGVAKKQLAALDAAVEKPRTTSYECSPETLERFRGATATEQAAQRLALAFKVAESNNGLLTTVNAELGAPRTRMVDSLVRPDSFLVGGVIWISTRPSTRKVRDLAASDRASMTYVADNGAGYIEIQGSAKYIPDCRSAPPGTWKSSWEAGAIYKSTQPEHLGLIAFSPSAIEVVLPTRGVETDRDDWKPYTLVADQAERKWLADS